MLLNGNLMLPCNKIDRRLSKNISNADVTIIPEAPQKGINWKGIHKKDMNNKCGMQQLCNVNFIQYAKVKKYLCT